MVRGMAEEAGPTWMKSTSDLLAMNGCKATSSQAVTVQPRKHATSSQDMFSYRRMKAAADTRYS
jgi:hypothetical protein